MVVAILFQSSCFAKKRFVFQIGSKRYFMEYERVITVKNRSDELEIRVVTDFPGEVSAVVSSGLFGGLILIPCYGLGSFTCRARVSQMADREELYYWFVIKTEQGYYSVPNMLISRDILEDLGRVRFADK